MARRNNRLKSRFGKRRHRVREEQADYHEIRRGQIDRYADSNPFYLDELENLR